jgi:hypothetical protein
MEETQRVNGYLYPIDPSRVVKKEEQTANDLLIAQGFSKEEIIRIIIEAE